MRVAVSVLAATLCFPLSSLAQSRAVEADSTPPARTEMHPIDAVGLEYALGVGAAIVTVPSMIAIGNRLQTVTGELAPSLLLSALPYVVVVPLAITGSQSLLAGHLRPRSNFGGWATFATTLANVGLMVAGHGLGVSPLNTSSVVGFTALSALVLPAISVAVMYAASPGWKAPSQRPPSVRMTVGGIPHQDTMGTWHLPLLSGTF